MLMPAFFWREAEKYPPLPAVRGPTARRSLFVLIADTADQPLNVTVTCDDFGE